MYAEGFTYRYRFAPKPGFEFMSPEVQAISGYEADRFYADPDFDLKIVYPKDRGKLQALIADPGRSGDVRWVRKDGSVVGLNLSNVPVYEEGDIVAVEGIARVVRHESSEAGSDGDFTQMAEDKPVLTGREVEILRLVMEGLRDCEIGEALEISRRTVEHHVAHIRRKLGAANRTAAVAAALRLGLLVANYSQADGDPPQVADHQG